MRETRVAARTATTTSNNNNNNTPPTTLQYLHKHSKWREKNVHHDDLGYRIFYKKDTTVTWDAMYLVIYEWNFTHSIECLGKI